MGSAKARQMRVSSREYVFCMLIEHIKWGLNGCISEVISTVLVHNERGVRA